MPGHGTLDERVADLRKRFGIRVAELRTRRGLTQKQLAQSCGVGLQFIQKIEQGDRAASFATLAALAAALAAEVRELFNWTGSPIAEPGVDVELIELRKHLRGLRVGDAQLLTKLGERLASHSSGRPPKPRVESGARPKGYRFR